MRAWAAVPALWPVLRAADGQLTCGNKLYSSRRVLKQACLLRRRSPALPSIMDKTFMEDYVRVHNDLPTKARPAASNVWYTEGAGLGAHRWLQSPAGADGTVGQGSLGSPWTWDAALAKIARAWANKCIFEHSMSLMQKCAKVCRHCIQVVWDYSYKIRCAVNLCKEVAGIQNAANFVCNYSAG
ncbi:PREDICTED: glioma pathogenesis-related protein 1-like, partial [Cariama cristata]|uniref:glioma pathogenesis-related protein 1-like n=1 Tax=Cariama cristata TaxID=54380 RepID=UPI0005208FE5